MFMIWLFINVRISDYNEHQNIAKKTLENSKNSKVPLQGHVIKYRYPNNKFTVISRKNPWLFHMF